MLGIETPAKLRSTLLFLLGFHVTLQEGADHYNLQHGLNSQFKLGKETDSRWEFLEHKEDVSKCNSCGIHHRRLKRKKTKAYQNMERLDRCVVSVFKKYFSLRKFKLR